MLLEVRYPHAKKTVRVMHAPGKVKPAQLPVDIRFRAPIESTVSADMDGHPKMNRRCDHDHERVGPLAARVAVGTRASQIFRFFFRGLAGSLGRRHR